MSQKSQNIVLGPPGNIPLKNKIHSLTGSKSNAVWVIFFHWTFKKHVHAQENGKIIYCVLYKRLI